MIPALISDEQLTEACRSALTVYEDQEGYQRWITKLTNHLIKLKSISKEEFTSYVFQQKLWNGEAVSALGQGDINVDSVMKNPLIVERLWTLHTEALPETSSERIAHLLKAWDDCIALISPLVTRTPRLKLYSVFAALKPTEFTTISHLARLRQLAGAMGVEGRPIGTGIELHRRILDRLAAVIGPVSEPPERTGVERMTLPWLLVASKDKQTGSEAVSIPGVQAGSETLVPLPAERRRRGMLAIGGYLASIRSMIEFARDGCSREDFKEHIRSINPRLAPTSVGSNLNALIGEWGVLDASGEELSLTERGEALLESGDPEEVSEWLLTRILGFDHVLFKLREKSRSRSELLSMLQQVNPGWTSTFAPSALINWVRVLGLAELDHKKNFELTADGRNWAGRIHWTPESLPELPKPEYSIEASDPSAFDEIIKRPSLAAMSAAFPISAVFADAMLARLDAGLWNNERRHFAVLAGLSGAGKTLLARNYALALWSDQSDPSQGLYTLPVQPGWHDPASLLGYVNPLASNAYVRTGFLDFLLRACADPRRPYTVVLDEMNLSHPEQYLAPLLSAMETGGEIELHTFEEDISGVPPVLTYPNNLVIIGTVNMDETTHGLSDKILDRASVIEFWDVDVVAYPGWETSTMTPSEIESVRSILVQLGDALRPAKLHFGWRSIGDILGYIHSAALSGILDAKTALDHAIFAKILPKLRGEDTKRLRLAFEQAQKVLHMAELKESSGKLKELIADLHDTGSARFWR